jgi:ABC-type branched-subunit amino acid transport system substrate-binding protein
MASNAKMLASTTDTMASRFQRRVLLWANGMVKTGVTLGAPVRFSTAALLSLLVCTPAILDLLRPQAWAAQTPPTQARAGKEILLGQSAPLSGRSRQIGLDYRDGALAWFAEVNRRGGIHGRRIRLISLDDNYEPQLTVRNTKQLINQDRVFALFGYVGTPTVKAILPLVEQAHIPLVAPLTGATVLRQPFRPLVINRKLPELPLYVVNSAAKAQGQGTTRRLGGGPTDVQNSTLAGGVLVPRVIMMKAIQAQPMR